MISRDEWLQQRRERIASTLVHSIVSSRNMEDTASRILTIYSENEFKHEKVGVESDSK